MAPPPLSHLKSSPPVINQSEVGEARLFSKDRHLRGLKNGSGNPEGGSAGLNTAHASVPANDDGKAEYAATSRSWPFAYALGLALIGSAVLWAVIAAVLRYF